jgi:hypothetical protein
MSLTRSIGDDSLAGERVPTLYSSVEHNFRHQQLDVILRGTAKAQSDQACVPEL